MIASAEGHDKEERARGAGESNSLGALSSPLYLILLKAFGRVVAETLKSGPQVRTRRNSLLSLRKFGAGHDALMCELPFEEQGSERVEAELDTSGHRLEYG